MTIFLRHGDLDFRTIASLPKGKAKKVNSYILAEGEYTGHNHELKLVDKGTMTVIDVDNEIFFKILGGKAQLTHPEHKTITFDEGVYQMKKEREFDYFMNETRQVRD